MDLYGAAAAGIGQRGGGGHRVDRRRGLYHIGIVVTAQAQVTGGRRGMHLVRMQWQWREVGRAARLLSVQMIATYLAGLVRQCGGGDALPSTAASTTSTTSATTSTADIIMMMTRSVLARLARGGGHLTELGRRQRMIQQGAARLLILIMVLGINQGGCGRGLLIDCRDGRRIQRAQVPSDRRCTAAAAHSAQLVHQAHGLHPVL